MTTRDRLRDLAVSDTGFLFDPYSGASFSLNATGRFILERLKTGDDTATIETALAETFALEQGDDPGRDVREFVALLRDYNLLPRDEGA